MEGGALKLTFLTAFLPASAENVFGGSSPMLNDKNTMQFSPQKRLSKSNHAGETIAEIWGHFLDFLFSSLSLQPLKSIGLHIFPTNDRQKSNHTLASSVSAPPEQAFANKLTRAELVISMFHNKAGVAALYKHRHVEER